MAYQPGTAAQYLPRDQLPDLPQKKLESCNTLDLFDNPVGYRTSLPKNADFLAKSTFFVVFQRKSFRN
jgi:hypothetical protein